jgi:hypothetical protein
MMCRIQLAQICGFFAREGINAPLSSIGAPDSLGPTPAERLWGLFRNRAPAGGARPLEARAMRTRFTAADPRELASAATASAFAAAESA